MSKLYRISKLAGFLRGATIAAMIAVPIIITFALWVTPLQPEFMSADIDVSPNATRTQMIISVALDLLSPLVLLWTLNEMRKLFGAFVKGDVLTNHSAQLIQRIGQGFLTLAIISFARWPIQSVLLTMANPPNERSISVFLDDRMIFFSLSGGLIIVIGWAMREACSAAAENRSFI